MNKLLNKIAIGIASITMAVGVGVALGSGEKTSMRAEAADGTQHAISSFTGKGEGVVINNKATPKAISLSDQGYTVKQVIIGWSHNKSNDGVTATVKIGGTTLGTGKVGGSSGANTTTIGDGNSSLSGAVNITWSNSMSGTGKGTLYINTLTLVEGSGGSSSTTYTITYNKNAGSDTVNNMPSADTDVSAGTHVLSNNIPTRSGYYFIGWGESASTTAANIVTSITVSDDTIVYAVWEVGTLVADALTASNTNSDTSYKDWSNVSVTSSAIYAGNSYGGGTAPNKNIQLRSNNSDSGVVTTTSGGTIKRVLVSWTSSTSAGRTIDVYGKNTAYSAATDLYNNSNKGTLIGSIVCGTSTSLAIVTDYTYIGLRSNNNSLNLDSITFYWKAIETHTVSFTVNTAGYGSVSQSSIANVPDGSSITTNGNKITINGTDVTATATASTAQYTYSFTGWSNNTGTVTADRTITANFERTTNTFTVGGTINNGSLSSTASIAYGSALNITLNPTSGYKLPTSLTSVSMGGNPLTAGSGYTYNNSNGAIGIASVTGNVVINATCPINATTHTITVTSITNGTYSGDTGEQVEHEGYTVQLTPNALYKYPESITISGAGTEGDSSKGWEYSSSDGIVYIYYLDADVTISAVCPAASIIGITVTGQKDEFTLGDSFSFGGTVKASYDDVAQTTNHTISTDLVDIDYSAYDPFTEDIYTIEVSLKSDDSISDSYDVMVTAKSIIKTITWELVEEDLGDFTGEYVILNTGNNYYPKTSVDGSGRAINGTAPTVTNKIIANDDVQEEMIWTINKEGDFETEDVPPETVNYYSIKNKGDDNYMISGSTKELSFVTTLKDEDDDDYDYDVWQIAYGTYLDIFNQGLETDYYLRSNGGSGWRCYNSGVGTKPLLYKKVETSSDTRSLIRITATGPADNVKKEGDVLTGADFTTTALYDTGDTDNTIVATVVSGGTLSVGSNTVGLSYTEGGITKTCEVTVVAAENTAELDGIVWSQEGESRTIFKGTTIGSFGTLLKHYDDESTQTLNLNECTVAIFNNTSGSKAHDIASPTTYTWNLSNDNGKYLGVTYEGYTKYSGIINVVDTINPVYNKNEVITWSKTTTINAGDTVTFVNETNSKVASSYDSTNHRIDSASYSTSITSALSFEVGTVTVGNNTYYTFHNKDGYLGNHSTGTTGSNYAYLDANVDTSTNKNYFSVSFDNSDNVVITSVYDTNRVLQLRSGTPDRFCFYGSSQLKIQLYKGTSSYEPYGDNIANTNVTVQKAVLEFAALFNTTMSCTQSGDTANVSSHWSSIESSFDTLLSQFTGDDLAHCKALFAGGDAVEASANGDTLQDMLARYEYILRKYNALGYNLNDFLHDDAGRPGVQGAVRFNALINFKDSGSALIIAITSIVSGLAIGGYFFLRKKKEQ